MEENNLCERLTISVPNGWTAKLKRLSKKQMGKVNVSGFILFMCNKYITEERNKL